MEGAPQTQECPTCKAIFSGRQCPTCRDSAARAPSEPEPPLPSSFRGFEIQEPLGRGGMGAVYKARQTSLGRLVALKVLSPERSRNPEFPARFEREAKALAALSHPNIVTVFDFGKEGALYFLAMEYVEGSDLRRNLQSRQIPPSEAMAILDQVLGALEYAHERGIVHRDIKPENILIDSNGRVKLADFGLAKMMETEGEKHRLTQSSASMGTLHYMAPEQQEGAAGADARSDLYSSGVVLYEMLTGELPVGRFEAPSKKAAVDPRLDAVLFQVLEKNPDRRPQTAGELRSLLKLPTSTLPPAPSIPFSLKWVALSTALVALLAAGVFFVWSKKTPPPPPVLKGLDLLQFQPEDYPGRRELWTQTGLPENPFRARSPEEVKDLCTWIKAVDLEGYLPGTLREGLVAVWRGCGFVAMEGPGPTPPEPESPLNASWKNRWTHRSGDLLVFAFGNYPEERKLFLDLIARLQRKLGLPLEVPQLSLQDMMYGDEVRSMGWSRSSTYRGIQTPFFGRTPSEKEPFLKSFGLPGEPRGLKAVHAAAFQTGQRDPAVVVAAWEYEDDESAAQMEARLREHPRVEKCEILRSGRVVAIILRTSEDEKSFQLLSENLRKRMGL